MTRCNEFITTLNHEQVSLAYVTEALQLERDKRKLSQTYETFEHMHAKSRVQESFRATVYTLVLIWPEYKDDLYSTAQLEMKMVF